MTLIERLELQQHADKGAFYVVPGLEELFLFDHQVPAVENRALSMDVDIVVLKEIG